MFSQTIGPDKFYYLGAIVVILVSPVSWVFPQQTTSTPNTLSSARKQFDYGKQLLEEGKFAQATAVFKELVQTIPNSPLLYNLLGFCDLKQGHTDEAVVHFKKATELKSDYKAAHNNLGGIYLMQGRNQEAIQEFSAVIRTDPKDAQAFYNLARAELATNNHEAGLDHLRTAYDLSPGNASIALALARLYLEQGKKELGRPIAQTLTAARLPDASIDLEAGKLLLDYGLEDAAQDRFRSALKANPKFQEILYPLASNYFKKQNYKVALLLLETLKPAMQTSATWHELTGYSYFKLGKAAEAVEELQKAMDREPRNQEYVLELAEVFVTHNNAAAAITLMETAAKAFPHSSRIWFGLGTAYLADQHRSSAEAALKKSVELDPKLDLAYVVLGQSYKEAGSWDELLATAQKLIDLGPNNPTGYYYKALALQSASTSKVPDDAEIEALLRKSLAPGNAEAEPHYELAKLLARQGRKEDSLLELQKIVQVNPDFAPAYYQLARLYRERGELEKSQQAQKTHEKIREKDRDKVMKRMIVEIRQRSDPINRQDATDAKKR
jgi:tetratricopeptide (TPR) repeat protein